MQFTDATGEVWPVEVNGGTIKRAASLLQVDLGRPLEGPEGELPFITRFDTDIVFKVDMLYVVCLPQIQERGLSDEQFAERLEGDALYAASEAFWGSLANFYRGLKQMHVVTAIEKQRDVIRNVYEKTEAAFRNETLSQAIDTKLTELGNSFATMLQSPASTPSQEHSES